MKFKIILALFLLSSGSVIAAESPESCPNQTAIRQLGSIYTAPTQDGKGEWLGVAAPGSMGNVRQFASAIFYPAEESGTDRGNLAKCTYSLENGVIDMRYKPGNVPAPIVKLIDSATWKQMEGPFGMTYFECNASEPGQCRFQEVI